MDGAEANTYPTLAALRQRISDWLEHERRRPTRTQDRRPSSTYWRYAGGLVVAVAHHGDHELGEASR